MGFLETRCRCRSRSIWTGNLLLFLSIFLLPALCRADDALPFDPDVIHRLSHDGIPRSLSVSQARGEEIFRIGYDLERGTPFRVWKAPRGKSGLLVKGFVTKSDGESVFSDLTTGSWGLRRGEDRLPVTLRYLSCSDHGDSAGLQWEILHETGSIRIREKIPLRPAPGTSGKEGLVRMIAVSGLAAGETLHLPASVSKEWTLLDSEGRSIPAIANEGSFHIVLPLP